MPTVDCEQSLFCSKIRAGWKERLLAVYAHGLSSSPDLFAEECDNLKVIFLKLKYPERLINSTITSFIESQNQEQVRDVQANAPVRIILPFKDQRSADTVRRQLSDLGKKINSDLRPVFTSKKIADEIKVAEAKPPPNTSTLLLENTCATLTIR